MVRTRSGFADAERTKSGTVPTLASDGEYELTSERFLFTGRRSREDSLGTRFNDIPCCSEKGVGIAANRCQGQTNGPPLGPSNL